MAFTARKLSKELPVVAKSSYQELHLEMQIEMFLWNQSVYFYFAKFHVN